jgi:hypothetical protein
MVKELEQEIAFYKATKPELLRAGHEGKIVLIKGRELIGLFATKEEAYRDGYRRFGNGPFLVKRLQEVEPVEIVPIAFPG